MSVLSMWRVTHLLALEDGPANFVFALTKNAGTKLLGRAHGLFLLFELVGDRTGGHGVDTQSQGMAAGLVVTLGRGVFIGTARK